MKFKIISAIFISLLLVGSFASIAWEVQYEPPINIIFIVHIEELYPNYGDYAIRMQFLQWLQQQALTRSNPFKLTILSHGDFAEYVLYMGDQGIFAQLENEGHEIGTHTHMEIQLGPFQWVDRSYATCRYGTPIYDSALTAQVWADNKYWVDQISSFNHTVCAVPFLCSDEAQWMTQNGFTADPGNRSEKGLDYLGHLVRHPFRPGSDDRLGHEIEEDLNSPFIYIDHYAQIGNENAHGYNCTAPALAAALDGCYQEWLQQEMLQGDSLDYKVWTFGVLTHLLVFNAYYQQQITQFLDYEDAHYVNHYTPRGNLIARYSTVQETVQEFLAWEASHRGSPRFPMCMSFRRIRRSMKR